MNKKITPQVIRTILIQALIVMVAVTSIGAAATVHSEFKATANKKEGTSENSDVKEEHPTEGNKTEAPTEKNTEAPTVGSDYEYAYAGFNPKITDVNVGVEKLLVNGDYQLPADYKPSLSEAVKGSGVMLDYRVAPHYQEMYDAAQKDGITLTPVSGYRSLERQKNNFEARIEEYMDDGMEKKEATIEAAKIIMLPGSSEHNAGLAMDICSLSESFENTDAFEWLSQHAVEYGFILRYPKSEEKKAITKVVYEPWHYRYVGVEAAEEITRKGITLEEYLGVN